MTFGHEGKALITMDQRRRTKRREIEGIKEIS